MTFCLGCGRPWKYVKSKRWGKRLGKYRLCKKCVEEGFEIWEEMYPSQTILHHPNLPKGHSLIHADEAAAIVEFVLVPVWPKDPDSPC